MKYFPVLEQLIKMCLDERIEVKRKQSAEAELQKKSMQYHLKLKRSKSCILKKVEIYLLLCIQDITGIYIL